ncbi:G protein-coupled glucose receptor regulating Gpa2-domain-containing protein [Chaetomium sp. MPI-CAGE-AT-0009]|nr:G protein-coupled glucose receptor regulating Gpa2-domain-containing protein [Chaetomium sp. MPI-CAGE-AT-0009]
MIVGFDIAPRMALAAPTEPFIIQAQSVVILAVSILSVIGGGWMVASFFVFSNLRSFRHQLILGLAVSDSIMALNFLLSSSMNVGGRWIGAPEQAGFCSFNGFMTQVFVIQTDYWVVVIAVYTYFVLTDQKRCYNWIQTHPLVPWVLPWILSVAWASIGLGITGYGDIGAWCWFTSDEVRLLVNFVPRWTIIVIMFVMYARLYFLLFRAHRRLTSLDDSSSRNLSGSGAHQLDGSGSGGRAVPARHTRKLKRLARLMLLYPLAYAVIWSLPTGIRIYQSASGLPAPWQLQTVDKACIVLQGLVDAVIYGATESSLASWRNLFFPGRFPPVVVGVPPAFGYGNASGTGGSSNKRWSSARAGGEHQQQQPVNSRTSGPRADFWTTPTTGSADSLGPSKAAGGTVVGSSEQIELATLEEGDGVERGTEIRKTVKIEVSISSSSSAGHIHDRQAAPQRPEKAYFPDDSEGSFLNLS